MTENLVMSATQNELVITQSKEFLAAFLCVAPAMFPGSLDQTIIAALPVEAHSFGGFTYVAWIVTGYLLTALDESVGRILPRHYREAFYGCSPPLGGLALMATITTSNLPNIDLSKPQEQV